MCLASVGARCVNVESMANVTVIFPHPPSDGSQKKERKKRQHWGVAEGQWAEQKEQQIGLLRVRKKAEKIKENPVI